jgi:hypothetical protein
MNSYINNIGHEKYSELNKMLIYKKLNPPEFIYTPTFRNNFVIHKIKIDLHGKGILREQYTYNLTNNKLIHYHFMYDLKTLKLSIKRNIIKKQKKTKQEIEFNKKCSQLSKVCNNLLEFCKKENDFTKKSEMIFELVKKYKDIYL